MKPINAQELNANLEEVVKKLEAESAYIALNEEHKRNATAGARIIKRNFFEYIVNNRKNLNRTTIKAMYGFDLSGARFNVIDLKLDYRRLDDIDTDHDNRTIERVLDLVESEFEGIATETVVQSDAALHLLCFLNYDGAVGAKIHKAINRILAAIETILLEFERYDITIGMGIETDDVSAIGTCIDEARDAVDRRIKVGVGGLIRFEAHHHATMNDIFGEITRHKEILSGGIDSLSPVLLEKWVRTVFNDPRLLVALRHSDYYRLAGIMLDEFIREVTDRELPTSERIGKARTLIEHCNSVGCLSDFLARALAEMVGEISTVIANRANKPIRLAIEYIKAHYREEIRLEAVAQVARLSPAYFSALFKTETGKNFLTYLTDVRISQAKQQLLETNDTIRGDR